MEWTPATILNCDLINHCLVIDTNVLLSNLNSVTAVIDKYIPGNVNGIVLIHLLKYNLFILFRIWLFNYCITVASSTRT